MRASIRAARAAGCGILAILAILAAGGCILAAGCGQKGPLYLPERKAKVVTHPAPAASGRSQNVSSSQGSSSSAGSSASQESSGSQSSSDSQR